VCPVCLAFKSIRTYDDYLLHHSICVAVYSVSVGIHMRMTDSQLQELALASLLHDIGLIMSDQSVLTKKEALTPTEYEQIKKHSLNGYELIKNNTHISSAVQDAVLHHHENANGTGYPEKLAEDHISPYARILHVVDVYDAIMSKRPYKNGMSNADAMNYLIGGKMILFDEQIVDKFLEILVPYPTGIEIRLSNDEIGQVIGQTADHKRPLIYLAARQAIINLVTSTSYRDITILNDVEYENKKKVMIVDDVFVSIAYTKLALGDNYGLTAIHFYNRLQANKTLQNISLPKYFCKVFVCSQAFHAK